MLKYNICRPLSCAIKQSFPSRVRERDFLMLRNVQIQVFLHELKGQYTLVTLQTYLICIIIHKTHFFGPEVECFMQLGKGLNRQLPQAFPCSFYNLLMRKTQYVYITKSLPFVHTPTSAVMYSLYTIRSVFFWINCCRLRCGL